jgi:hypothetical protein
MVKSLAMIAAWIGDKDLACEQLAIAIRGPSNLYYGQLKLMPLLGPAPRRSALRENRCLVSAERSGQIRRGDHPSNLASGLETLLHWIIQGCRPHCRRAAARKAFFFLRD